MKIYLNRRRPPKRRDLSPYHRHWVSDLTKYHYGMKKGKQLKYLHWCSCISGSDYASCLGAAQDHYHGLIKRAQDRGTI